MFIWNLFLEVGRLAWTACNAVVFGGLSTYVILQILYSATTCDTLIRFGEEK